MQLSHPVEVEQVATVEMVEVHKQQQIQQERQVSVVQEGLVVRQPQRLTLQQVAVAV
jgi:hypothetical protein